MFNRDFFPTPPEVIEMILDGEQIAGKVILEPSGGAGHIVKYLHGKGAKQVIACEKDKDLAKILQTHCTILVPDFFTLTSDKISHVDLIVMNPPFSDGVSHILHAFKIAPPGCKIIALCNAETIRNPYTAFREELKSTIEMYGQWQNLGDCFSQAERKTDVQVALVRIQKPGSNYEQEFEGFFMDEDPEEPQANAIIPYNLIRDLVNRYVASVKIFDEQLETAVRLNELQAGFFDSGKPELSISVTRLSVPIQRNQFKKAMQKDGWQFVFSKLNMQKYATQGLREDINKFVETQENVPFTMRNIYKMLEIVIGTQGARMDKAILEVFDKVTKHTHENRFNLEGWQTNSHYLLNKKFIFPGVCYQDQRWDKGSRIEMSYRNDTLEDLLKALCHLSGTDYDQYPSLYERVRNSKNKYPEALYGEIFEWAFFRCRAYKKGTMHFEFLDEKIWGNFNQRVAKLKGYPLPENQKQTKWQDQQTARQNGKKQESKTQGKAVVLETIQL